MESQENNSPNIDLSKIQNLSSNPLDSTKDEESI